MLFSKDLYSLWMLLAILTSSLIFAPVVSAETRVKSMKMALAQHDTFQEKSHVGACFPPRPSESLSDEPFLSSESLSCPKHD